MRVDSSCEHCIYCGYERYNCSGFLDPHYYCILDYCCYQDETPDDTLDAIIAEDQKNEMEKNYRGPEE